MGFASRRPKDALMLCLHPPCDRAMAEMLGRLPGEAPVIVEPLDCSAGLREAVAQILHAMNAKDVRMAVAKGLQESMKERMDWLCQAIDDGLKSLNNYARSAHVRMRCAIANLPLIAGTGRLSMPSVANGVPALICGAGPSLSSQFGLISRHRDGIFLISVGRAAPALVRAGIMPDAIVEIDPHAYMNWPEDFVCGSALVAPECVAPAVAARFERTLWCDSGTTFLSKFLREAGMPLPPLSVSGSVAVSALDFAVSARFANVALAGCDLSLSSSGESHISGGDFDRAKDSELVDIPGIDGGTVKTNANFEETRRALEARIEALSSLKKELHVFNCSAAGAAIKGAKRANLDEFLKGHAGKGVRVKIPPAPAPEGVEKIFSEAVAGVAEARRSLDTINERVRKIVQLLASDSAKAAQHEQSLPELFKRETELRASGPASHFSAEAFSQAQAIADSMAPTSRTPSDPRAAHYESLRLRCRLHAELLEDIHADMREAAAAIRESRPSKTDPYVHPAFRKFALRRISAGNKELADLLSKIKPGTKLERFELRPKGQDIPIVTAMTLEDGGRLGLASLLSFTKDTLDGVSQFLHGGAFKPEGSSVIFLAHVNWGMIVETANRVPDIECAVVEPSPELLAHMADTCMFMNLLPESALVVCADPRLKQWETALRKRIRLWRDSGKRVELFCDPKTQAAPELARLREKVAGMLA